MYEKDTGYTFKFRAPPTVARFMASDARVRAIMGPVGSGKSSGCVAELYRIITRMPPCTDGIRRSRIAVVRNTYPELKKTTIKTWLKWLPEKYFGKFNWADHLHRVKIQDIDAEVYFLALDKPADIANLKSMEYTYFWMNEAKFMTKDILDGLTERWGRYPSRDMCQDFRYGGLMDTNPPDDQSWWYDLAEKHTPASWDFFRQPPGMFPIKTKQGKIVGWKPNLAAENLANLPNGYYPSMVDGKDPDWVLVNVCGEYGHTKEGLPVYPEFSDYFHVAKQPFKPVQGIPIGLGQDYGRSPACAMGQMMPSGQWRIFDELIGQNTGMAAFARELRRYLDQNYPGFEFYEWDDPAGDAMGENDDFSAFDTKRAAGFNPTKAPQDPDIRIDAVKNALKRLAKGQPGILISPKCHFLRIGFNGGYCYRRLQVSVERYTDKPDKGPYSHVHEALQYLLTGGGESYHMLNTPAGSDYVEQPETYEDT